MIKTFTIYYLLLTIVLSGDDRLRQDDIDYVRKNKDMGGTMAWSRHVTGQDPNDLTQWDDFRSVATKPGPNGEDELWVVVDRTIDGNDHTLIEQFQPVKWADWPDSNECWFVDCGLPEDANSYGYAEIPGVPGVPGVPEGPGTYSITYISENASIWGIPVGDGEMNSLDADDAVNIGGGVVGLPFTGHPFTIAETIRITGTTNYNGEFTVGAGTTENQIQITDTYVAETFDGTEVLVKVIASLSSGAGHMVQDSSGNLYYGHRWSIANSTYVTKIETDGTLVYDFLNPDDWPIEAVTNGTILGMAIITLEEVQFLYLYIEKPLLSWGYMQKYNLGTGNKVWSQRVSNPSFDMTIDSDGNAYGARLTTQQTAIWASADGSLTYLTDSHGNYVTVIDEDMDAVITAGRHVGDSYNLYVSTLDDSSRDKMGVGGMDGANTWTIGTGALITDGEYIYVLSYTPTCTIYKISWDGTDLAVADSVAGPDDGQGIYFDLYGNLVVVNQDWISGQSDVLYFYRDTDLNYLSKIDNMYSLMLRSWDASVGGAWIQGDVVFDGEISPAIPAIPPIPPIPGVDVNWVEIKHLPNMDVCVYADGIPLGVFTVTKDANGLNVIDLGGEYDTVIAGINYYSIYESFPIEGAKGEKTQITGVRMDFHETMGCNLGVSLENSSVLRFSDDDFATKMAPYTGPKVASFPRGVTRDPILYLWQWDPIPMTIRGLYPKANVFD